MSKGSKHDERKVALYVRVSSRQQAEIGESLDEQEERLMKFCDYKEWAAPVLYREEGRSAKDVEGRPVLQRLLADVRSGKVSKVVVKKLDRLSRSILDFEKMCVVFEEHDTGLISLQENFDTSTAIGRGVVRMILVFAQLEREQIAERTSDIRAYMVRQGRFFGGYIPLGYDLEDKRLVVNEVEAAIVREIFSTYIKEGSLSRTAKAMNEKGYRTKVWTTRKGNEKGGHRFTKSNLSNLLNDPTYVGKARYKDEIFEGIHEAIVDPVVFNQVLAMLETNKTSASGARSKHMFLLKGLVHCSCGAMMTTSFSKGRNKEYRYYRCTDDQDNSRGDCPIGSVNADELEELVVRELKFLAENPTVVDGVVADATHEAQKKIEDLKIRRNALGTSLQQVGEKIHNVLGIMARFGDQGEQTDLLMGQISELREQQKQLQDQEELLTFDINDCENRLVSVEIVRENFEAFTEVFSFLEPHEQYDLIHLLIKEIHYNETSRLVGGKGNSGTGSSGRNKRRASKGKTKGKVQITFWDLPPLGDTLRPIMEERAETRNEVESASEWGIN